MPNSAAAFASFPTEDRGILLANTYKPISLHTADVHVLFSGYAAQVTLSLEYINETNKLVKAIAAYPVPPGFQLQFTTLTGPNRSITNNDHRQSRALKTTETGRGKSTKSLYDVVTSAVATQMVPWEIGPGDSVLMTSVYHAPLAQIQRQNEITFTMPPSLFSAVVRPPEAQRNYIKSTGDRSSNRRVGKAGWLYLTVEGELYRPLRGNVTLDKGGHIIAPQGEVELKVNYTGDSGFCLTYHDALPTKAYTQQPLTVRAPVGEVVEPLRLHTVTVPPTETATGAAAVALTMAPSLANCPVNAELVFVVDVHTAAMAHNVAEAVAAVMSPIFSTLPDTVTSNVVICSDTRRHGCVALFPMGSVAIAMIPHASVSAYIKEEIAVASKGTKGSLAQSAVYSPQLPAVLHDILAGRNVATAVPDGYVRNVILMSDAGWLAKPSESAAMINDAASFATNTRVHCVALGPTADRATLETLALIAGGRYRCPATTAVPPDSAAAAHCDLVTALSQVLVAAAVPCLVKVRTVWKLVSASRAMTVRLAAEGDGTGLPCIPRDTKRVLYGLLVPTETARQQEQKKKEGESLGKEDVNPPRLDVRVTGCVGNLALDFTAATLITRIEDAAAVANAEAALSSPSAAVGGEMEKAQSAVVEPPLRTQSKSRQQQEQQDSATGLVSLKRDSISCGSPSVSATSLPNNALRRNGRTLLLYTAATAARIAFLSSGHHAVTPSEAQEMIELSRRCMLPSPYTTLTNGQDPFIADDKTGGVVYMPSVGAVAQITMAIRTRQAEVTAVAPPSLSHASKEDKKFGKKNSKDTTSLYSIQ